MISRIKDWIFERFIGRKRKEVYEPGWVEEPGTVDWTDDLTAVIEDDF